MEQDLPAIGSQFGVNDDDSEVDESIEDESGLTPEKMLLLVGLFTGVLSVILLGILMLRRSDPKTFDNVQYESE